MIAAILFSLTVLVNIAVVAYVLLTIDARNRADRATQDKANREEREAIASRVMHQSGYPEYAPMPTPVRVVDDTPVKQEFEEDAEFRASSTEPELYDNNDDEFVTVLTDFD